MEEKVVTSTHVYIIRIEDKTMNDFAFEITVPNYECEWQCRSAHKKSTNNIRKMLWSVCGWEADKHLLGSALDRTRTIATIESVLWPITAMQCTLGQTSVGLIIHTHCRFMRRDLSSFYERLIIVRDTSLLEYPLMTKSITQLPSIYLRNMSHN